MIFFHCYLLACLPACLIACILCFVLLYYGSTNRIDQSIYFALHRMVATVVGCEPADCVWGLLDATMPVMSHHDCGSICMVEGDAALQKVLVLHTAQQQGSPQEC